MSEIERPTEFYRFRGYTASDLTDSKKQPRLTEELKEAAKARVWFSALGKQNDPFDTNPQFIDSQISEVKEFHNAIKNKVGPYASLSGNDLRQRAEYKSMSLTKLRKELEKKRIQVQLLRKIFNDRRNRQKICCFSNRKDNSLMWSYYSSSHSSFCYNFSVEGDWEKLRMHIAPIKYTSDRPVISTTDMIRQMVEIDHPEIAKISETDRLRLDSAMMLTKSIEWEHEAEWRCLKVPREKEGYHNISPLRLKGITFGVRADHELISYCRSVLGPDHKYFQASLDPHNYKLRFGEI